MNNNVSFCKGKLTIDIQYLFDVLSDDDKAELERLSAYHSEQMMEIERYVMEEFAAHRVNPELFKLRIKFLTGDGADERIADTVRTLVSERDRYEKQADELSKRYWTLYHWIREQGFEPFGLGMENEEM